jgi:mono/diheme cytochrome c family protein
MESSTASESMKDKGGKVRFPHLLMGAWTILTLTAFAEAINDPVYGSDLEKGKRIFERANCVACHAGGGNMMDPGHPIKGSAFAAKYNKDEVLEMTIRKGFPEFGMPSVGSSQVNALEMKDLIAYVRSLDAPSGKIQKAAANNGKSAVSVKQKNP